MVAYSLTKYWAWAYDAILANDTKGKSAVGRNGRRREDISGKGFLHLKRSMSIKSLHNEREEKAPFLPPEVILRVPAAALVILQPRG